MGVDYFPCDNCGESCCDCGDYYSCDCGKCFCVECDVYLLTCKDSNNEDFDKGDIMECSYCTIKPSKILLTRDEKYNFLLKKYNLTDEKVINDLSEEIVKNQSRSF